VKKTYKNRAMRTVANESVKTEDVKGDNKDKIKIYLGGTHRELAEQIAKKMHVSLEELIQRYIAQMVADNRWPR
tara:strand:+ start:2044 stop:2265 length:222 start_codon:yes stop_codon:yes gene_type:complete